MSETTTADSRGILFILLLVSIIEEAGRTIIFA
jgi:hypothetical protein